MESKTLIEDREKRPLLQAGNHARWLDRFIPRAPAYECTLAISKSDLRKLRERRIKIPTLLPQLASCLIHHFLESTGSDQQSAWLVSSNGFDVIGAVAHGMKAAWIQRSKAVVFDHWEYRPTIILDSLDGLANSIGEMR